MENCNKTWVWDPKCIPAVGYLIFGALSAVLLISLCLNIYCCVSKYCSGNRTDRRKIQSQSSRQMEENPIYGNLGYSTSVAAFTEGDPFSSPTSQSQNQDCYANLTLKAARPQSGPSAPPLQFSEVVHLEEPPESEKEEDSSTDVLSTVSELYASVQTRAKTLGAAEGDEGYANHL